MKYIRIATLFFLPFVHIHGSPRQEPPTRGLQQPVACHPVAGRPAPPTVRRVALVDFDSAGCRRDLRYFQRLEYLPNPAYAKLRKGLHWNAEKDIHFKAGVSSGEEQILVAPGIQVVRIYSGTGTEVRLRNTTGSPVFIEAYDVARGGAVDDSAIAFIAAPAGSTRMIYRIAAMTAAPMWFPGDMKVALLTVMR